MTALLEVEGLVKQFPAQQGRGPVRAVDGVSFSVRSGQTLGIVGESGCGKSTVARLVLRLIEADAGSVRFDGGDVSALSPRALRALRRDMQIVFQDPYASLDPRMKIADVIAEPLVIHAIGDRASRHRKVEELLDLVGLDPSAGSRYPHEFSGGQRQRIGIARAIALEPKLVILDEPVSALDVSIQAQVLNLLQDLKTKLGLAYVFISHDLSVIEHVCAEVAVMYLGRIVEFGPAGEVFATPRHPYTQALLSSVPGRTFGRGRIVLAGDPPSPDAIPAGCRFHPRCPAVMSICRTVEPEDRIEGRSRVACHLYGGLALGRTGTTG